ncbi:hypothetical protein IWW57_002726, partial [Coemansia sp. S610]
DSTRQEEIQRDAEYARRLAETEIAARSGRARSASASVGRREPNPPTAPAVPSSSPSSSKIRSMFRFGRRSESNTRQSSVGLGGGSPLDSVPGSSPSTPLQVRNNAGELESDFSDASESGPSNREESPPPPFQQQPPQKQPRSPKQQADLIGLLDGSSPDLATSYVPLSPSKLKSKPAEQCSVSRDTVDMNNPFAVEFDPLAPGAAVVDPVADMSMAAAGEAASSSCETNPFRARRQVGPTL